MVSIFTDSAACVQSFYVPPFHYTCKITLSGFFYNYKHLSQCLPVQACLYQHTSLLSSSASISVSTNTTSMSLPAYLDPSKHAGSDSHPRRIGWEVLARSGPYDSCTLAYFRTAGIRLAKTRYNQPELNRLWAGFVYYYPGHLWKNANESENGKLVAGRLRLARNRAR